MLSGDPNTFVPTAPVHESFYKGHIVNAAMLEHFPNGRVIGRTFPTGSRRRVVTLSVPSADAIGIRLVSRFQAGVPIRYYRNFPTDLTQFEAASNEDGYDDMIAFTVGDESLSWYNNVIQQVELTFKGIANVL